MSRAHSNNRALAEAHHMAAMYRRAGFPDACSDPNHCIDELGDDKFYTYTVSVYVGKKDLKTIAPLYKRLAQKMGLKF